MAQTTQNSSDSPASACNVLPFILLSDNLIAHQSALPGQQRLRSGTKLLRLSYVCYCLSMLHPPLHDSEKSAPCCLFPSDCPFSPFLLNVHISVPTSFRMAGQGAFNYPPPPLDIRVIGIRPYTSKAHSSTRFKNSPEMVFVP